MKYVEFIGASGVGKTTMKLSLVTAPGKRNYTFLDQEAIPLQVIETRMVRALLNSLAALPFPWFRKLALLGAAANRVRFISRELTMKWDKPMAEFLEFSVNGYFQGNELAPADVKRIFLSIEALAQTHFVRRVTNSRTLAVMDEGIFQRGISLAQGSANDRIDLIEKYYRTCPVPSGVILVVADEEVIRQRLETRGADYDGHFESTARAVTATSLCRSVMEERGVPIFQIDATGPCKPKPRDILQFVNSL